MVGCILPSTLLCLHKNWISDQLCECRWILCIFQGWVFLLPKMPSWKELIELNLSKLGVHPTGFQCAWCDFIQPEMNKTVFITAWETVTSCPNWGHEVKGTRQHVWSENAWWLWQGLSLLLWKTSGPNCDSRRHPSDSGCCLLHT